jgi:hypothetical protein
MHDVTLLCDDVLARMQVKTHTSIVWFFQYIFAVTRALMVNLMLILANFTVHSMGNNFAAITIPPPPAFIECLTPSDTSRHALIGST